MHEVAFLAEDELGALVGVLEEHLDLVAHKLKEVEARRPAKDGQSQQEL